jgi:hypothetical protein
MAIIGSLRSPTAWDRWNSLRHPISPQSLLFFQTSRLPHVEGFVSETNRRNPDDLPYVHDSYQFQIFLSVAPEAYCIRFHILLDVRTCIINVFIRKENYVVILMYPVLSLTHVLDILDKSSMGVTLVMLMAIDMSVN